MMFNYSRSKLINFSLKMITLQMLTLQTLMPQILTLTKDNHMKLVQ